MPCLAFPWLSLGFRAKGKLRESQAKLVSFPYLSRAFFACIPYLSLLVSFSRVLVFLLRLLVRTFVPSYIPPALRASGPTGLRPYGPPALRASGPTGLRAFLRYPLFRPSTFDLLLATSDLQLTACIFSSLPWFILKEPREGGRTEDERGEFRRIMDLGGLEPLTSRLSSARSNQLSYKSIFFSFLLVAGCKLSFVRLAFP